MSGPAVCSISGPVRDELKALRFRKTGPNSKNADSKVDKSTIRIFEHSNDQKLLIH